MLRRRIAIALVILAACDDKGGAGPSPSASAPPPASARPAGPVPDPKVEAMARGVLACKAWESSFDTSCPAMKAWSEAKADFDEGKSDAALVALLADGDEKLRYLAAFKLNQYGRAFKTDRALASAVVAAAEQEKGRFAAYELGAAVGRLRTRETGTFDRVRAIVERRDTGELRRGILSQLLYANGDDDAVFQLAQRAVKDPDPAVALAALTSFWTGGASRADATCQLYADNLDNPNDELAAEATNALSWYKRCSSRYDALLDSLDKRVKAGPARLGSTSYVTSARHVCEDPKATDPQRARAAAMARTVAQRDYAAWVRSSALDTVVTCDKAGGRAFLAPFKADPEKSVADKAKELLAKK
jgi:hypothetical protein